MLKFYSTIEIFRIINKKTKKVGIRILYSFNENYAVQVKALLQSYGVLKTLQYLKSRNVYVDYFDYYGDLPLDVSIFPLIQDELLRHPCFVGKTLRSFDKVAPLLKMKYPSSNINPISLYKNSIIFDNPIVSLNGKFLCKWLPYFEDKPSADLITVQDNYLSYGYHKDIYILTNCDKRHIPSKLEELFIINLSSGKITLTRQYIENLHIYYESYIWSNGWNCIKYNEEEITGFKRV